jgi:hypothetical protein
VAPFEVRAGGDVGERLGYERAEFAKRMLDVLGRRGPQAELHLGDIAAGHLGDPRRDAGPAGHRHRWLRAGPGETVEVTGMEERQL